MYEVLLSKDPQPEVVAPDLLQYPDRIADTFQDKTILITGGTGLVGKVLLDKLLRCCREVKKIYLLVRPKNGKTSRERTEDMFNNPLFQLLKSDKINDFWPKIVPIHGDVSLNHLGISDEDRNLLEEEVNIVYHCAASVRFDEPFKKITTLNVRGTKFMLDLAYKMKQLELFVHVSTAYAYTHEKVLKEETYSPPANPNDILTLLDLLDDEMFNAIESKLLGTYPNAYAFTKALAEGLVNRELENGNLPIMICRPSVVVPIYRHPLPGWIDNKNGPSGLLIAAGKGVLRSMYMSQETYADFIPVDLFINVLCIITHVYISEPSRREELNVINAATSSVLRITWKEIIERGKKTVTTKLPFNWTPWYPGGYITKSYPLHVVNFYMKQMLPALIIDAILYCLRIEPVLLKVQDRISKGYKLFSYYTNNQWNFDNHKILKIRDEYINPREAAMYPLAQEPVNIEVYFTNAVIGARRYLLNERDEDLPTARRHLKQMYVVDKVFHLLLYYFIYCVLCKLYNFLF